MSTSGRPMRPTLSRDYILHTALHIVDRDGSDKLTMRRLGTELGVDPMAIYHYVPNKAALFDGIAETIWSSLDLGVPSPDESWQQQLIAAMRALRGVLRAHPNAVALVGTQPVTSPELLTVIEQLLGFLTEAGMPTDADTADLLSTLVNYTIGQVLAEVGEPVGAESAPANYQALSPQTHPHLSALLNNGWTYDPDAQYDHGLNALLAGWRQT
ncbi:Transcriptional regulator [Propionibacterium freudenreichii]|nr:Transcriptional regulator [Propionibacterium freudenreichii]